MTSARTELLDRYAHALLPVFGRPQLVLTHGEGSRVWDADGRQLPRPARPGSRSTPSDTPTRRWSAPSPSRPRG